MEWMATVFIATLTLRLGSGDQLSVSDDDMYARQGFRHISGPKGPEKRDKPSTPVDLVDNKKYTEEQTEGREYPYCDISKHCKWSAWRPWGVCSATGCDEEGTEIRIRDTSNCGGQFPFPCLGDGFMSRPCSRVCD